VVHAGALHFAELDVRPGGANLSSFAIPRAAMPKTAAPWSLTSLREKLIKIGAKVVSHRRGSKARDERQDFLEHLPWHRDLGHLESDVPAAAQSSTVAGGPRVRIHLPPPASHVRTCREIVDCEHRSAPEGSRSKARHKSRLDRVPDPNDRYGPLSSRGPPARWRRCSQQLDRGSG
jgi:hypothetical protein